MKGPLKAHNPIISKVDSYKKNEPLLFSRTNVGVEV